jgi:hypothetical protein
MQQKLGVGGVAYFAHLGGVMVGVVTLITFKRRVASGMAVTEKGELRFEELPGRPEAQPNVPVEVSEEALLASLGSNCSYCRTLVTEAHRIAPNLCRCPNPACNRLVYWR